MSDHRSHQCSSATKISSCQEVLMLGYDFCFAQKFILLAWNHPFEILALYTVTKLLLQNKRALHRQLCK